MQETFFDDGTFPPPVEVLKAAAKEIKQDDERPAPFDGRTQAYATYTRIQYDERMKDWFAKLLQEEHVPNAEQLAVLKAVRDRLLTEIQLANEGPTRRNQPNKQQTDDKREDPMLGLVHGYPGTGKSKVIGWVVRLFIEVMGWEHGVQFVCVAFQNKVAHAMGGNTLHASGDIPIGGQDRKLDHTDIDVTFSKNQHVRWVLVDEVFMIPDELLGLFEVSLTDAAPATSRYKFRADQSLRRFGGYNMLMLGDMNQLPPIPAKAALFNPPTEPQKKKQIALDMLNIFWGEDANALNFYQELTEQKRCDDEWYTAFLDQCRNGSLTDEMYNFLMGLPTEHAGSWIPTADAEGKLLCGNDDCAALSARWRQMALDGKSWSDMQSLECQQCSAERGRRNRLVEAGDERVLQEPFLSAPYVHRNNEPKYHAMLLRAVESAKRHETGPQHILWIRAEDVLHNPQEVAATPERVDKKRARFLQFHDQKTAGIPGIFPLHKGMKVRMTEKITKGKKITILKHQSCTVAGWDLHPADRVHEKGCERLLNYFPRVIYLHFEGAKWRIHKDLPLGVFPLKPVKREWTINNESGAKATRQGFTLVPDFASTAFMIQGVTLDAMLAECGDILDHPALAEMVTTYVILSRIKKATGLLLLRAFAPNLFRMGSAPGPHCLLKLLRRRFSTASSDIADYTAADATEEYQSMSARWESLHKQQKTEGTKWRCFDCQLEFPAQGYTAKSSSRTDILNNCLLPGHWRRCVACTLPADIANDARHQDAAALRRCQKCNQNRDVRYFDNDSLGGF